jgi:hypothetical protein
MRCLSTKLFHDYYLTVGRNFVTGSKTHGTILLYR